MHYIARIVFSRLIVRIILQNEQLNKNKLTVRNFSKAKEKCIILHPLPRNDEIEIELDSDPRSVYFRQMKYGLYVRIALLEMLFS